MMSFDEFMDKLVEIVAARYPNGWRFQRLLKPCDVPVELGDRFLVEDLSSYGKKSSLEIKVLATTPLKLQ